LPNFLINLLIKPEPQKIEIKFFNYRIAETTAMIYSQLPINCRFFPIDVNDEVFQIKFLINFPFFLDHASKIFMELVDETDERGMTEEQMLYFADWAKHTYQQKERIEKMMDDFRYECFCDKHKKYIVDNVPSNHIGFDFGDLTYPNVDEGIVLYNQIVEKL
jgi:hypothetical protein